MIDETNTSSDTNDEVVNITEKKKIRRKKMMTNRELHTESKYLEFIQPPITGTIIKG